MQRRRYNDNLEEDKRMKTKARHALKLGALIATSAFAAGAAAADWSDTYLGYRWGNKFREPNNPNDIRKDIVQLTHASGYKYGSNFFNVDTLLSDANDRAHNSSDGAHEIYVLYRHQLQFGKLGAPTKFGPVRDLAFTLGFDFNSKNTTFAPRKRAWVAGPTIKFDVPGFLDLSVLYYKESNHRGIPGTPRPEVSFDPTYMISASWNVPFAPGGVPLKFQGFINYTGEKGKDYLNLDTEPETLSRSSLMLDVGQLAFGKKNSLWLGVGYEYWKNKFGNRPGVGTQVNAAQIQLEYHF